MLFEPGTPAGGANLAQADDAAKGRRRPSRRNRFLTLAEDRTDERKCCNRLCGVAESWRRQSHICAGSCPQPVWRCSVRRHPV